MATTTFHEYTGDGSDKTFDYSFPTYFVSEVKVQVDGVIVDNYTVPSYATSGTKTVTFDSSTGTLNSTVCESTGAPKNGLKVRVYRDTTIDAAKHTFQVGSSVKAGDLNTNQEQILRALQEEQFNTITTADIADNSITGAKIKNDAIDSQHYAADSIDTEHYAPLSVDTAALAGDAVNGDKIANTSIDSEHYVVGSIDTAHLANDAVNVDKIADDAVETGKIKDLNVTTAKLANESVTSAKIANATITHADIANDTITATQMASGAITGAKLGADSVDGSKIANDSIDSEHVVAGALDNEHYAAGSITSDKLNAATVVINSEQAAATANDTSFFTTAASDSRYFNISSGDTIKDGQTFPDNDTTIATTAAINDRIIDLVDDVGGFVPLASEDKFPATNPDVNNGAGTIVSIGILGATYTPSSGTCTIPDSTLDNISGSNVTITDCGTTTLSAGFGCLVETTTTLHTYKFHRLTPKATEVTTVAGKATEIGRLGTAAAVEDMGLLGTTDCVADMALLATSDVVADLAILGTTDVVSDLNTLATSDIVSDLDTCATNVAKISTVSGKISDVETVSDNISAVENFADLYQIDDFSPSAPTTDGGGNAVAEGDLAYDSTANKLKVYTGSAWETGVEGASALLNLSGGQMTGNITMSGSQTVDGRDLSADGTKLDGIEASAKDDQTAAEIRTLVGNATDSNVFTDADHTKLDGIEASATADQTNAEIRAAVEAATDSNVFTDADHTKLNGIESSATADQTGAEIKSAYEGESDTNAFTDTLLSKLNAIEASATADQTNAEIRTAVEAATDSNVFTDADHTKLNAIEASADVTDATNVDAAGAVMNSDLDGKGELLVGDGSGDPSALGVGSNGQFLKADSSTATGLVWAADNNTTYTVGDGGLTQNNFTNTLKTKLDGIEASADVTDATNVNAAGAIMHSDLGTKGQIVVGDGSGDATILGVGSNTHVLTADSSEASGVKWAAAATGTPEGTAILSTGESGGSKYLREDGDGTCSWQTVSAGSDTTYSQAFVDSTDDIILRLTAGGSGSGNDDVKFVAGSNITLTHTDADNITIASTDTNTQLTEEQVEDFVGGMLTGNTETGITVTYQDGDGTIDFVVASQTDENFTTADHSKLDGIAASANNYVHPNHSGEVTSTADGATVIADDVVDEANLKISNSGSNGQFLSKQSGNTGGLTWATVSGTITALNNQTANRLTTIGSTTTELDGEASLTFEDTTSTGLISGKQITGRGFECPATVSDDWTIAAGNNAMFPGPMTVAANKTVTVPANRTLTIV